MYINSPGGEVSAGLAVYDTMQVSQASPVVPSCKQAVLLRLLLLGLAN